MMGVKMRVLMLLVAGVLCAAPANACIAYDFHRSILHNGIDAETQSAGLIGYGRTSSEEEWIKADEYAETEANLAAFLARQKIKFQIIDSKEFPELEGKEIWIRYIGGSCGPHPRIGQTGYLIGKMLEMDEQGLPAEVLAQTQTYEDKRRLFEKMVRDRQAE